MKASRLPDSRADRQPAATPPPAAMERPVVATKRPAPEQTPPPAEPTPAPPSAGDDPAAKAVVLKLIDQLGFDAVDAGTLDESWKQQPGTPGDTTDHDAEGVQGAMAAARKERTAEWRATEKSPGSFAQPA